MHLLLVEPCLGTWGWGQEVCFLEGFGDLPQSCWLLKDQCVVKGANASTWPGSLHRESLSDFINVFSGSLWLSFCFTFAPYPTLFFFFDLDKVNREGWKVQISIPRGRGDVNS